MEEYNFPAPLLRLAFSSVSLNLFSETLHEILPAVRTGRAGRAMKKTTSCKKATELPNLTSSLIGQKNIVLANQLELAR